jgi:hypothetical protein
MNIVALKHALEKKPVDYAFAPVDTFKQMVQQAEQLQVFAKAVREFVDQVGEIRYAEAASHARQVEGRDFGVVRIEDHGETVVCDLRKIVDWDQMQLNELAKKISALGDDPTQYMDVALKVRESKFTAWPTVLREQFEAARTLRPGKSTYRLASLDTKEVQ